MYQIYNWIISCFSFFFLKKKNNLCWMMMIIDIVGGDDEKFCFRLSYIHIFWCE